MSAPWNDRSVCEVCDQLSEGIKEVVCKDCRDAYPEDYADLDADDEKTDLRKDPA